MKKNLWTALYILFNLEGFKLTFRGNWFNWKQQQEKHSFAANSSEDTF